MSSHRLLKQTLTAYRIGDKDGTYPVFSGEGAKHAPGRWNKSGQAMIYTSARYSTALLEKLVRLGEMPPRQYFVEVEIPPGVSYEEITEATVPGWYEVNAVKARRFGSNWFRQRCSALLIVPSVVARFDNNILINPEHDDFQLLKVSREKAIWWDARLFAKS